MTKPDIGASVRARLFNKAKAEGRDFNLVLTRFPGPSKNFLPHPLTFQPRKLLTDDRTDPSTT